MATSPRSPLASPRLDLGHTPLATPTGLVSVRMSRQMSDAIRRQKTGSAAVDYWTLAGSGASTSASTLTSRPFSRARAQAQVPNLDVLVSAANSAGFVLPRWRSQSVPRLPRPATTLDVTRPTNGLPMETQVTHERGGRLSSMDRKPEARSRNLTCLQLTDAILAGPVDVSSLYGACSQRMRYVDLLEEELAAREQAKMASMSAEKFVLKNGLPKPPSVNPLLKHPGGTVSDIVFRSHISPHVSVCPAPPPPSSSSSPSPSPTHGRASSRGNGAHGAVQTGFTGYSARPSQVPSIPKLRLNHADSKMDAGSVAATATLPSPRPLSRDNPHGDLFRGSVLHSYGTYDVIKIPPTCGDLVVRGTVVPLEEADKGAGSATPRGSSYVTACGTVRRYVTPSKVCAVTPRHSTSKRRGVRFSRSDLVYEYVPLEALPD